ncbi:MAG: GrpB family protein [Meiothermus sp.]|nr:GrpB family protein [Meiothermus sp.]
MPKVIVTAYNPEWAVGFERLKALIWPAVSDFALSVEHVGSTSVVGLAAKPVIDLDVVIPGAEYLPLAVRRLATLGYTHRGDLGIEGRDAFEAPQGLPRHHLYVCPQGSLGLRNHLALRDYLRAHPEAVRAYAKLKLELARQYPYDIDRYVEGKTGMILGFLREMGLGADHLESVRRQNGG